MGLLEDALAAARAGDVPGLRRAVAAHGGGDPVLVLRDLAASLDRAETSGLALEIIEGAMLLAPEDTRLVQTRCLVAVSLGLADRARADAERTGHPMLRDYVKVIFPLWEFWPAREAPATYYEGLPSAPAQDLLAVHAVIAKYATRLALLRAAIVERLGRLEPWLPLDLTGFGRAELLVSSFKDADEDGDQMVIEIDENPDIGDDADVPGMLRQGRADWAALGWLCWACGLREIALPERIDPPSSFGAAAGMASQRLWRCRDRVHMGGVSAQKFSVPSFKWEGLDIDEMHELVAEIPMHEYAETQAMWKWLTDRTVRSPWQDDLRGS